MAAASTARTLPGRYAKFLTALAGNALVYADITYGATNRWVELATAAAVALGVLAVPNAPAAPAVLPPLPPGYPGIVTMPGTISEAEAAELKRQLATRFSTPAKTAVSQRDQIIPSSKLTDPPVPGVPAGMSPPGPPPELDPPQDDPPPPKR